MLNEYAIDAIRSMAKERKAKYEEDRLVEFTGTIFDYHSGSGLYKIYADQNGHVTKIITPEGDAVRLK